MRNTGYDELTTLLALDCMARGVTPLLPCTNADGRRPVTDGELMFRALTVRAGMLDALGQIESIEVN